MVLHALDVLAAVVAKGGATGDGGIDVLVAENRFGCGRRRKIHHLECESER